VKIAIGFSRTNNLPSKIIRFFIKSPISHAYVRIYDKFLKTSLILHSDWGGVQFDLAEKFDMENIAIEEYIINDNRFDDAIRKNLWHLGKGYAYIKLINWAWAIIIKRWFIRKVKDPITKPSKLICSDFVLYILNSTGIVDIPIGSMTPADLRQWFENNHKCYGWKRVVREKDDNYFFDFVKKFLMGE